MALFKQNDWRSLSRKPQLTKKEQGLLSKGRLQGFALAALLLGSLWLDQASPPTVFDHLFRTVDYVIEFSESDSPAGRNILPMGVDNIDIVEPEADAIAEPEKEKTEEGPTIDSFVVKEPEVPNVQQPDEVQDTAEAANNLDSVIIESDVKPVPKKIPVIPTVDDIAYKENLTSNSPANIYLKARQYFWGPNPPPTKPKGDVRDYVTAARIFQFYVETFPKEQNADLALYNAGLSFYKQGKDRAKNVDEKIVYYDMARSIFDQLVLEYPKFSEKYVKLATMIESYRNIMDQEIGD